MYAENVKAKCPHMVSVFKNLAKDCKYLAGRPNKICSQCLMKFIMVILRILFCSLIWDRHKSDEWKWGLCQIWSIHNSANFSAMHMLIHVTHCLVMCCCPQVCFFWCFGCCFRKWYNLSHKQLISTKNDISYYEF